MNSNTSGLGGIVQNKSRSSGVNSGQNMSGRSSVKHSMQGVVLNHQPNTSHNKLGKNT